MPQLAHAKDVASMSEEGIAGLFVNAHGFVHDMVTLRRVRDSGGFASHQLSRAAKALLGHDDL